MLIETIVRHILTIGTSTWTTTKLVSSTEVDEAWEVEEEATDAAEAEEEEEDEAGAGNDGCMLSIARKRSCNAAANT